MLRKRRRKRRSDYDPNAPRTPSGQKSRAKPKEDLTRVAVWARQRVYGLSPEMADHERAETALGRWWLATQALPDGSPDKITESMFLAGAKYRELYLAAQRCIQAPKGFEKPPEHGNAPDWDSPDFDRLGYTQRAVAAVAQYRVYWDLLGFYNGAVRSATHDLIVNDISNMPNDAEKVINGLRFLAQKMGYS